MSFQDTIEDFECEDDTQDYQSSLEDSELSEDMIEPMGLNGGQFELVKRKIRSFRMNGENFILKKEIYEGLMSKLYYNVMELLCLNLDDALIVFHEYNWSIDKLKAQYFSNQEYLFDKLGFSDEQREPNKQNLQDQNEGGRTCSLCLNEKAEYEECKQGHSFCKECWLEYCKIKIADRIPVFRCLQEGCKSYFRHSQILKSLQNQDGGYKEVLVRLYTQDNKGLCLCPSPDCIFACEKQEYAVIYSMKCICGTEFCFKCGEFSHYPASCQQKQEFVDQVSKEYNNIAWIATNARLCPFCHLAVQRTQGCNKMICPNPCNKAFCYECEQPWDENNKVVNHKQCNSYQKNNRMKRYLFSYKEGQIEDVNNWSFYYTKYQNCQDSKVAILNQKQQCLDSIRKAVSLMLKIDFMETKFLLEGFDMLLDSTKKLQWSYVLEYFLDKKQSKCLRLFQDLVDQLASYCQVLYFLLFNEFNDFTECLKYSDSTDETLALFLGKMDVLKINISQVSIGLKVTQKLFLVSVENGTVDLD